MSAPAGADPTSSDETPTTTARTSKPPVEGNGNRDGSTQSASVSLPAEPPSAPPLEESTDSEESPDPAEPGLQVAVIAPRRRRWPFVLLGAVAGASLVLVGQWVADRVGTTDREVEAEIVELATAVVETRDLVEEVEWSGSLAYGQVQTVTAVADGTVTRAAEAGSLLGRGDELIAIDEQPVIVIHGELPAWRDLRFGDVGEDVRQLETNLVALGHDPEQVVTIDDDFDEATAVMVERWQQAVGAEVTGTVPRASIVVTQGLVSVSAVTAVGQPVRAGVVYASLAPRANQTDILNGVAGTITAIARPGVVVQEGTILYHIDGYGVMVLEELDPVAERLLDPEPDIAGVEAALSGGGFDPDNTIVIDGLVDEATHAAVERWQASRGLPRTGRVDAGYYLTGITGLEVGQPIVDERTQLAGGRAVVSVSSPTLAITVPVSVADADEFAAGDRVTVVLVDGTELDGEVLAVSSVSRLSDEGTVPTVEATIDLDRTGRDELAEGPVTVRTVGERVEQALVVPTRALISLREGGFAVEKLRQDGTTELVAVETGSFDDGVVEVTGDLLPGDEVVVPR